MYKIEDIINTIICGNTSTELKKLPSESINCIITSPPYWGLRDYQAELQIWDGDENCQHDFSITAPPRRQRNINDIKDLNSKEATKSASAYNAKKTNFCSLCGAWRGSLGLEPTFDLYIKHLYQIFGETKRVLRKDGTCWINIGDTYASSLGSHGGRTTKEKWGNKGSLEDKERPPVPKSLEKSLCLIPFRFAIEMVNHGWILRNTIIWYKRNCMPSSVKDRFTVDFEYIFFFVKNKKYWFEQQYEKYNKPMNRWGGDILKADGKSNWDKGTGQDTYRNRNMRPNPQGRNRRCIWDITTKSSKGSSHFATFPEALVKPMLLSGCPEFVCPKCGKAREKIEEILKDGTENKKAEKNRGGRTDGFTQGRGVSARPRKLLGYTDCSCNAGFEGGIVLDPFIGRGTTGIVAKEFNRKFIGIDINPEYCKMAEKRLLNTTGSLF